jgi:ligand-binding sensor domain-containing protein
MKTYYHNKQEQMQVFLSLCEDDKGQIWTGTFSSGVYVINGKTRKETAHYLKDTQHPFAGNFIFDICKDYNGDLWQGSVMGDFVYHYISKENKFKYY